MRERDLFLSALEIDDPAARLAYLQSECADNPQLLAEVQIMLESHAGQSQFLKISVVEQIAEGSGESDIATIASGEGATQSDEHGSPALKKQEPALMSDDSEDEMPLGYLEPSTESGSLGRLAHYEVLEVIGRGAFGTVLRAFDQKLRRVVAIKVLAPEMATTSPARKRFIREAQASAAIRHEHVVSIYAVEEKPIPYLVMEYIPGVTLQQRLDEGGPLDVTNILRLGRQIAEGLAAAHAQSLIHRDIKPGNILLETGIHDRVKITDFGLARTADDASLTQSGTIAGTPMYMAPEQALGHKLDSRADLFSFGSVLYQMVSGRPPFRAPSALAVLKRVTEETPRPISEIIPETPHWLSDIITKLHAKNPDDRYQSAREVADALADCEARLKANAELQDFSRIPAVKPVVPAKWNWLTAGGVLGVVLLLGMIIITLTKKDGTKTTIRIPEGTDISIDAGKEGRVDITAAGGTDHQTLTKVTQPNVWPVDGPKPAIAPFGPAQARTHQEAWARHLGVPVEYTNAIGMKLVLIPPGEFVMGSTAAEIDAALTALGQTKDQWQEYIKSEAPQHKVILTQPIYLGVNEVTQAEYEKVMGTNPAHFAPLGKGKDAVAGMTTTDHPVEMVSWYDAAEFCIKLSQQENLKPFDFGEGATSSPLSGTGYRLPTEAEWEFACRAGTSTKYGSGDQDEDLVRAGWFGANSGGRTHAARELNANPFGLYDMHGNLWEHVREGWNTTYYGQFPEKLAVNPNNPFSADVQRVIRGGSWSVSATFCWSADRLPNDPTSGSEDAGFRVSLPVDAVKVSIANHHPRTNQDPLPPVYTNSLGMEFVIVPKGKSWLGGSKEKLGHTELQIPADFYLGKYEVTQGEWEKVMGENPSHFSRTGDGREAVKDISEADLKRFPIEMVSWDQCQIFVKRINEKVNDLEWEYRLPTAAEWEYACRGGPLLDRAESGFNFYLGMPVNALSADAANFFEGSVTGPRGPCRVGNYSPNRLGLFDMHGNVWEWCEDEVEPHPMDPNRVARRVDRGGGWDYGSEACRADISSANPHSFRGSALGVRLARVSSKAPTPAEKTPRTTDKK
jgi:formylglycine-generating enzyme required for sulfatase activity/serine/threonine protein kinase